VKQSYTLTWGGGQAYETADTLRVPRHQTLLGYIGIEVVISGKLD
jgi:hypothetical protein